MDAADHIRHSLARVTALRALQADNGPVADALLRVKAWQSQRFRGTYADLMQDPAVQPATQFFLDELYGAGDFRSRDAQFGRIAGTLQTAFPRAVVDTALKLARLHALTETLDHAMAEAWESQPDETPDARRYALAWRQVGQSDERRQQIAWVVEVGQDLARLTRTTGLRSLLRMMRRPAQVAGLAALQHFLETGFDTFGALARQRGAVERFLQTVRERETRLMEVLFDAPLVACETELAQTLGQAR